MPLRSATASAVIAGSRSGDRRGGRGVGGISDGIMMSPTPAPRAAAGMRRRSRWDRRARPISRTARSRLRAVLETGALVARANDLLALANASGMRALETTGRWRSTRTRTRRWSAVEGAEGAADEVLEADRQGSGRLGRRRAGGRGQRRHQRRQHTGVQSHPRKPAAGAGSSQQLGDEVGGQQGQAVGSWSGGAAGVARA